MKYLLKKIDHSGHHWPILCNRGTAFRFLHFSKILTMCFSYIAFIWFCVMHLCLYYSEIFSWWDVMMDFYTSLIFIFYSIYVLFTALCLLNKYCIPGMKSTWSQWMIFSVWWGVHWKLILMRIVDSIVSWRLTHLCALMCPHWIPAAE